MIRRFGIWLVAGIAGIGPATAVSAHETLTIASYGGAYTASQMRAFVNPYREHIGDDLHVEVVDFNGGLVEIEAQVRSLNVKWDVVDLELADVVRGCEQGLLEPIDPAILAPGADGTPAAEDFLAGTLTTCGIGQNVWSTVIAYNRERFSGAPPATLRDFFDLERFPGRRGLRKVPRVNLEWALLADGVPAGQIYEVLATQEGQDRAFAMLDRIKPQIVWWEVGAVPPRLLIEGRVAMTSAYNGRIQSAIDEQGVPLAIIWDAQVRAVELWAIPKGTPRLQQALDFIAFATAPARLAAQAQYIAYGPARTSAMAMLSDDVRQRLPTAEANSANVLESDFAWWAEHQAELDARFQSWLAGPRVAGAPTLGTAR